MTLWRRILDWWHTCPICQSHTGDLEAHYRIDHAGDDLGRTS